MELGLTSSWWRGSPTASAGLCLAPGAAAVGSAGRGAPASEGHMGEDRGVGNSLGLIKDPAGVPELSLTVSRDIRKIFQSEPWSLTSVFVFSHQIL